MSVVILVIYIIAWVIVLIRRYRKIKIIDAASIVIIANIFCAVIGLFLYINPLSEGEYLELRIGPYIYLFAMLILFISPLLNFDANNITRISPPKENLVLAFSLFLVFFSLAQIPHTITHFREGILKIITDISAGQDLYEQSSYNSYTSGYKISNLPAVISGAFSDVAILWFYYYLTLPQKKKLLVYLLGITLIINLFAPIASGQRTVATVLWMTVIAGFFLMRTFFSTEISRKLTISVCILSICLFIPLFALTESRFGDRMGGSFYSIERYLGQATLNFNNYGLNAGGIRYGDRTFNLFKRIIDDDTPVNYIERRIKYSNLKMDDGVFYTFVGDFTLDFGPIIAVILFALFAVYINHKTRCLSEEITFYQLLLLFFVLCVSIQGSFYLFTFSDIAGIKLIAFIILYIIFKSDYLSQLKNNG